MVFTSCALECGRGGAIGRDCMFVDYRPRFSPEIDLISQGQHNCTLGSAVE